jgi:hypothetical protein
MIAPVTDPNISRSGPIRTHIRRVFAAAAASAERPRLARPVGVGIEPSDAAEGSV